MRQYKLKKLAGAVIIAMSCGASSYAAQMTNQQIQALVDQVVAQKTQGLQKEVGQLNAQVAALKQKLRTANQPRRAAPRYRAVYSRTSVSAAGKPDQTPTARNLPQSPTQQQPPQYSQGSGYNLNRPRHPNYRNIDIGPPHLTADNDALTRLYLGGTPIFTSPYIGEHSAYDGSDLIVNQSSVNLDTRLLKQGQAMDDALVAKGFPIPTHPMVEVSGAVEGLAYAANTNNGTATAAQQQRSTSNQADVTLSDAEFDIYAQADPWVFGYLSFAWADSFNTPYRVGNANAIIDKAFLTVGNLSRSPFYGSFGQLYVPFGQYASYMISDPLTKTLARTKGRAIVLGLYPRGDTGVFASTYVFKSDTSDAAKSVAGGANLGYNFAIHNAIFGSIAGGIISNIADSIGMQINGAPSSIPFGGFSMNNAAEQIYKAVPAADINGIATYKHLNLMAEYVDTTTTFDPRAMTFNNGNARPSAGQVEGAYTFAACGRPGSFAIGYNWTQDALALLLPKQRYIAAINYSIWRDTMESLEFRHDINYSGNDTATGAGSVPFSPLNKTVNMATVQIAVFF